MPEEEGSARTARPEECSLKFIVHMIGIDYGPFTSLKNIKEPKADKLLYFMLFIKIIAEPQTSPSHIDVCRLIPESLEGMNLETVRDPSLVYFTMLSSLGTIQLYSENSRQ